MVLASKKILSQSVEDYLKAIYTIEHSQQKVITTQLAQYLGVRPASATGMIKKLAEMNLVRYRPYQGVGLTSAGKKIALEIIRHHRLLELYLNEMMGVPWDKVHDEAERLEHALSEELEDRIDELLGYPTTDPHGALIPTKTGEVPRRSASLLSEMKPGKTVLIAEVDDDPELLRYVARLGLYPGIILKIESVEPLNGPLKVTIAGKSVIVGREVARSISVTETKKSPKQNAAVRK